MSHRDPGKFGLLNKKSRLHFKDEVNLPSTGQSRTKMHRILLVLANFSAFLFSSYFYITFYQLFKIVRLSFTL